MRIKTKTSNKNFEYQIIEKSKKIKSGHVLFFLNKTNRIYPKQVSIIKPSVFDKKLLFFNTILSHFIIL
jgi:hypothetical protein